MNGVSPTDRSYPAKVLLFGEHTVLRGGRGLAVPYPRLSLCWTTGAADPGLLGFADYLRTRVPATWLNHATLLRDLTAGHRLVGNIPTGYGLGSSGAVCAAIWDRYGTRAAHALPPAELRRVLAELECFFHGQSSGTDPLISFLQVPMLFGAGGAAGAANLPPDWETGFFLVDTGLPRDASVLIRRFTEAYDEGRIPGIAEEWMVPVEAAITALLEDEREQLHAAFARLSAFQLAAFPSFVPEDVHTRWDGGEAYRLKLCGAGGGGMVLGLARDRRRTEATFGDALQWLGV